MTCCIKKLILACSFLLSLSASLGHEFLSNDPETLKTSIARAASEAPCLTTVLLMNYSDVPHQSGTGVLLNRSTVLTACHVIEGWNPDIQPCNISAAADAIGDPDHKKKGKIIKIIPHPDFAVTPIPQDQWHNYASNLLKEDSSFEELYNHMIEKRGGIPHKRTGPDLAILKIHPPLDLPRDVFLPIFPSYFTLERATGVRVFNPSFGPLFLNKKEASCYRVRPNHRDSIRHLGVTVCDYSPETEVFYDNYKYSYCDGDDLKYKKNTSYHPLQSKTTFGASGSPLITKKGNQYYLFAIQSSIASFKENAYSHFTPLTPYLKWISAGIDFNEHLHLQKLCDLRDRAIFIPFTAKNENYFLVRSSLADLKGFELKNARKTPKEQEQFKDQFDLSTSTRIITAYDKSIPKSKLSHRFPDYKLGLFSIYKEQGKSTAVFVGEINLFDRILTGSAELSAEICIDIDPMFRSQGIGKAANRAIQNNIFPSLAAANTSPWLIDWSKLPSDLSEESPQPPVQSRGEEEHFDFFYQSNTPFHSLISFVSFRNAHSHAIYQSLGFVFLNQTTKGEIVYTYPKKADKSETDKMNFLRILTLENSNERELFIAMLEQRM